MSQSSIIAIIGFASLSGIAAWLQARWQNYLVLVSAVVFGLAGMLAMKWSNASFGLEAALDPPDSSRKLLGLGFLLLLSAPYLTVGALASGLISPTFGARTSIVVSVALGLTLSLTFFGGLFK